VKPHTLITGATGLVGRRWLSLLLDADPDREITAIVRNPGCVPGHERLNVVKGDLSLPYLGMCESVWDSLRQSITEIIHCAANIRFNLGLDTARGVNTRGTGTMLDLARRSRHLERFAHISTVYVAGRTTGTLPEAQFTNTEGFFNTYQQSKYDAEQLVFQAMQDVPAGVFRLSSIIGDSGTGRVSQFNYFHQILRFVPRNPFPVIPAAAGAGVDVIAEDWAVAALSNLYERHFRPGAVYNICAGAEQAINVGEIVDEAFARFGSTTRPRFVPLDEFERFAEGFHRSGACESHKEILRAISYSLPHLAILQNFENSRTQALLNADGIAQPDAWKLYRSVLDHCTDAAGARSSARALASA
jgi:nucleoside-diphosphate-sugar epimerase